MSRTQEIRANFDKKTITVYQAYNKAIAIPAIKNNQFQAPFSFKRMTWIKPSYLWLMERSNWGLKSNQEYILAIKIYREYWEQALEMGILTHPDKAIYKNGWDWEQKFEAAKVHIQWDPERSLKGAKLNIRSIQIGISRHLIEDYNKNWIHSIEDYTPLTKKIRTLCKQGNYKAAKRLLPQERLYPTTKVIEQVVGIR